MHFSLFRLDNVLKFSVIIFFSLKEIVLFTHEYGYQEAEGPAGFFLCNILVFNKRIFPVTHENGYEEAEGHARFLFLIFLFSIKEIILVTLENGMIPDFWEPVSVKF